MTGLQPVFVHGWGFGPEIWRPVLEALGQPSSTLLDLGYFGAPKVEAQAQHHALMTNGRPVLLVGHSFGFLWGLSQGAWPEGSRFLGINAFGRFSAGDTFAQGVAPRVLSRMQAGLQRDAGQVVNSFRARCGAEPAAARDLCVPALADGLNGLMTLDARPVLAHLAGNVRILAGEQDPIVSPDMTRASLPAGVPVEWQGEGGHMLPLTHPHICAGAVRRMMSETMEKP